MKLKYKIPLCVLAVCGLIILGLSVTVNFNVSITPRPQASLPATPEAYEARAADESNKGEIDQAIDDLTKAIQLKPNDAFAYAHRAMSRVLKGEYEPAAADINKAIQLKPND